MSSDTVKIPCPRCCGKGHLGKGFVDRPWGTCFKCAGSGGEVVTRKVYERRMKQRQYRENWNEDPHPFDPHHKTLELFEARAELRGKQRRDEQKALRWFERELPKILGSRAAQDSMLH